MQLSSNRKVMWFLSNKTNIALYHHRQHGYDFGKFDSATQT